jgi:hypothetical protein
MRMAEINELHRQVDELEEELKAVLAEKAALLRALRQRRLVLRATSLFAALVCIGCWALTAAAAGTGTTVAAPFEVLDRSGKPIFAVKSGPRGFELFRINGTLAAGGVALDNSAFFKVAPDDQNANVALGLQGSNPVMTFRGPGQYDMIRFGTTGGTGRMVMMGEGAKTDIIQFLVGLRGEGEMELNSAGGQLAVLAGSSQGGYGRVEALPLGNPMGSFIVGRPKQ